MTLETGPNLQDPDGFYAELVAAQTGMSLEEGAAFSARLVLILANHIGDGATLSAAIAAAKAPEGGV